MISVRTNKSTQTILKGSIKQKKTKKLTNSLPPHCHLSWNFWYIIPPTNPIHQRNSKQSSQHLTEGWSQATAQENTENSNYSLSRLDFTVLCFFWKLPSTSRSHLVLRIPPHLLRSLQKKDANLMHPGRDFLLNLGLAGDMTSATCLSAHLCNKATGEQSEAIIGKNYSWIWRS